jgi:hypothetical protein
MAALSAQAIRISAPPIMTMAKMILDIAPHHRASEEVLRHRQKILTPITLPRIAFAQFASREQA